MSTLVSHTCPMIKVLPLTFVASPRGMVVFAEGLAFEWALLPALCAVCLALCPFSDSHFPPRASATGFSGSLPLLSPGTLNRQITQPSSLKDPTEHIRSPSEAVLDCCLNCFPITCCFYLTVFIHEICSLTISGTYIMYSNYPHHQPSFISC